MMRRTPPAVGRHAGATRYVAGLLATLMVLPLALGACAMDPHRDLSVTTLDAAAVQEVEAEDPPSYNILQTTGALRTQGGAVSILETSRGSKDQPVPSITIISRSAEDDSLQWAITIVESEQTASAEAAQAYEETPQNNAPDLLGHPVTGIAVVSPDGQYLSVLLRPRNTEDSEKTIANQRTRVMVVETRSGRIVRSEEVAGLVLGQALTNDSLAVETAQDYYPGGRGKGTITVYPLEHAEAEPTTIPTDQWLVGAGQDSLLLSARSGNKREAHCRWWCYLGTITQVDMKGETLTTITGAFEVHTGGRVERYTDPEQAAALATRQAAADQEARLRPGSDHEQEDEELKELRNQLSTEVVDVDAESTESAGDT